MTGHPEDPPRVRRTSTSLADGRELIYFDDSEPYLSGDATREVVDERPLDERPTAGTMRLDALTGDWVSIADHRQNRTFLPPTDECPYARAAAAPCRRRYPLRSMTWSSSRTAFLLSPPAPLAMDLLLPSRQRRNRLRPDPLPSGRPGTLCWPMLPRWAAARSSASPADHDSSTGRLLGADLIAAELDAGSRVVIKGIAWTAYVPYAARWPVEVHLAPNRDVPDLGRPGQRRTRRALSGPRSTTSHPRPWHPGCAR